MNSESLYALLSLEYVCDDCVGLQKSINHASTENC